MTRLVATGLLLWAISPALPAAAQSAVAPLMEEALVQGLHVRVSHRPEGGSVDIGADCTRRSQGPQAFGETTVQVWVAQVRRYRASQKTARAAGSGLEH